MKDAVVQKVCEANDFEAPNALVNEEINARIREFEMCIRDRNMHADAASRKAGADVLNDVLTAAACNGCNRRSRCNIHSDADEEGNAVKIIRNCS